MADDKRDSPRPFDVRTVEYLLKLMTQHELAEIELREGNQKIRLRKGGDAPPVPAAPAAPHHAPAAYAPPPHAPTAPPAGGGAPAAAPAAGGKKLHEIKSPMVGTYYSRPKPDKDDYVKVGGRVTADTTVCLIEAMKLYNDIKAEVAGTVAEVCVKNGDPVEFNTVLFRVDTGN